MRTHIKLAVAAFFTLGSLAASADTIHVSSPKTAFSGGTGAVTLDPTSGRSTGGDSAVTTILGKWSFADASASSTYTGNMFRSDPLTTFTLELPVSPVVSYSDGSLCTPNSLCTLTRSSAGLIGLDTGHATAGSLALAPTKGMTAAATPKPSGLLLLGTGVLCVGAMLRRRSI